MLFRLFNHQTPGSMAPPIRMEADRAPRQNIGCAVRTFSSVYQHFIEMGLESDSVGFQSSGLSFVPLLRGCFFLKDFLSEGQF